MGRRICLGVLALCMVIGGFAQAARKSAEGRVWNVKDIPMPHLSDASRYVSNPDRIITSQTEKALNGMLKDLDAKTNSMTTSLTTTLSSTDGMAASMRSGYGTEGN